MQYTVRVQNCKTLPMNDPTPFYLWSHWFLSDVYFHGKGHLAIFYDGHALSSIMDMPMGNDILSCPWCSACPRGKMASHWPVWADGEYTRRDWMSKECMYCKPTNTQTVLRTLKRRIIYPDAEAYSHSPSFPPALFYHPWWIRIGSYPK